MTTEQVGRVVVARLDSPPHALLDYAMVEELDALVKRADANDAIGAVVLTGTHPERFLAHYDVAELLAMANEAPAVSASQAKLALRATGRLTSVPGVSSMLERTQAAGVLRLQHFHDVLLRIGRSGAIFIAAINGDTAGGGLELALACDLRFLSDRGELAQPEVLLGFPPGGGGTQRMARLIGRAAALELMLSGRVVAAEEAKTLGLVTEVVAHDGVLDAAVATARQLATRFKPAVATIKRAVLDGASLPLEHGLRVEQSGLMSMFGEPKVRQSMAAYVEHTTRTGELPAADPDARRRLTDGTFSPFYP